MAKLDTRRQQQQPQTFSSLELGHLDDAHPHRCTFKNCNKLYCKKPWHKPYSRTSVMNNLRPALLFIGWTKVILGILLIFVLNNYTVEFDRLYGTADTELTSSLSFVGLLWITASGFLLLISVWMNMRSLMWLYLFMSIFLCSFIFGLSIILLQYGLYNAPMLVLKIHESNRTVATTVPPESVTSPACQRPLIPGITGPFAVSGQRNFLFGRGPIIGLLTLFATVLQFIASVTVFTYYNLKFIQTTMFK